MRLRTHATIAGELAALPDDRLAEAVAGAAVVGVGIGGAVATIALGGARVFVKRIPLADLERRPENVRSTANLFALPMCCQYGVSSPGFGAWRELAANLMATSWVTAGQCDGVPLLHHWRVLPCAAPGALTPEQAADVERQVAAWGGIAAMRDRLTARYLASAQLVLFLEYFPTGLRGWLGEQLAVGDDAAGAALRMVERELLGVTSFMNGRGLVHFDAHLDNIRTDGERVYLSDFGQALSSTFTLAPPEAAFLAHHRDYDRAFVATVLVNIARGAPVGARICERYGGVAAVMTEFFRRLREDRSDTRFPAGELARACDEAGMNR